MKNRRRTATLTALTTAAAGATGLALLAGPALADAGSSSRPDGRAMPSMQMPSLQGESSTGGPAMQRMEGLMQDGNPGMQRMHEQMQQDPGMEQRHRSMTDGQR